MESHVIDISLPNDNCNIYYTDFCGRRYLPYIERKEIVLSLSEDEAKKFGKLVKKNKDGEYVFPIKITDKTKIKCKLGGNILYEGTPGLNYLLDERLNITKANLCVNLFTGYVPALSDISERISTRAYLVSMDAEAELKLDPLEEKYKDYYEGGEE